MLTLQKLRYKNFLSAGNKFTEIDLTSTKTTLIIGSNGAGKSTMVDALSYALFGKPHRNIKKAQLVNSVNAKDMLVEVEFSVGDSEYKVVRGQRPNKFEIWKDDVLINQSSHTKKYQKILETNILHHNFKSFHQVEVLGSSSFVPFMKLPAWTRREVIEDLLDINIFSRMNTLMKTKQAELKERSRDNSHEIELLETKIDAQRKHIAELRKITDKFVEQHREQIEELQSEIADNQQEIDSIEVGDLEDLNTQLKKHQSHEQKLRTYLNQFIANQKQHNKDIKFYTEHNHCPTCDQDIDQDFKEQKVSLAREKVETFSEAEKKAREEIAKVDDLEISVSNLIEQEKQKLSRIDSLQNTINSLQKRISVLQKEMENLSKDDKGIKKAEELLQVMEDARKRLYEQRHNLAEEREYNLVIMELLKDSGFKTKIIKQYLPVINNFVNKYLQVLDFFVHFELDEEFKETIRSRHRDDFSYDSFSEGEKQRIDLALLFTWRQIAKMKNSVSTNMLILDETFDSSLDADGVENLMKILDTIADDTNVFVISHKPEVMQDQFDRTLVFDKPKNFSTYHEVL